MFEFDRIVFFDADTLPIRAFHTIFDASAHVHDGKEYLFAAGYDSGESRRGGVIRNKPGLDDLGSPNDVLNAGVFLLKPSEDQARYIFDMFKTPPKQDFTVFMEQDFLRWAYREAGPYPWIRLPHLYNTMWCRDEDLDTAYVLHDKLWQRGPDDALRKAWYQAWGEMAGWDAERNPNGIQSWLDEMQPHP
jgi:alpha-N-acetylglucosamine transferase